VLGEARKIVVSNQNLEFTWRNSEQLKGDLIEASLVRSVAPIPRRSQHERTAEPVTTITPAAHSGPTG
jgi:hypothetical protein